MKYLLSIAVLLISVIGIKAQINLQSYIDIGESNVSEGLYLKNVYRSNYQYQKYNLEAGIQFDLISNNPNTLTGLDMIASRNFLIKDFPVDLKGYFILNRFSDILHETNLGLKLETKKLKHLLFGVGTNFKSYKINSAVADEYNIDMSNRRLNENFNLIYVISAYLKPHDNHWNIGLSITNSDYYMINQSTNPVFNLQTTYKVRSKLTLFFDAWYKQAGVFNISANYFGYFFRGGIQWDI